MLMTERKSFMRRIFPLLLALALTAAGTLLLVEHDAVFLERVCTQTVRLGGAT